MQQQIIYKGLAGAKAILELGTTDYLYTALPKIEEMFIEGLIIYFNELKENGHWNEIPPLISAVYPVEKEQNYQITVEAFTMKSQNEGFNHNQQTFIWEKDSSTNEEFLIRGATFTSSVEIKCIHTTRVTVARLTDKVFLGLQTNIDKYLKSKGISIPANSVNVASKPLKIPFNKTLNKWETTIAIDGITMQWQQILEQDGNILKNIGVYINYITENE